MATDADRLNARRLYVESELPPSDLGIARQCGIDRGTVKRWREAEAWDIQRAEFWHRCRTDTAVESQVAADTARAAHRYLTHAQRLEILHDIATDLDAERRDRIAAVLACNKLDPAPPAPVEGGIGGADAAGVDYGTMDAAELVRLYRAASPS